MAAADVGQRQASRIVPAQDGAAPRGVGGWLLLFCALLLVYQPLSLAYAAPTVLESLATRGLPTALLLAARVVSVALGIAGGLALVARQPAGVRLARVALVATTATDLFIYATPFYPNYRLPGDTPYYVATSLVYCGTWLTYLARSRRVANTFD